MLTSVLKRIGFCFFVFAAIAAAGSAYAKINVFVSLVPQKYFVQQIGKDLVDIQVMVPAGADFHIYEPKPKQMAALTRARLYFAIGIEFETAKLKRLSLANPEMIVVHTDQGIQKIPMADHHHRDKKDAQRTETESGQHQDHPASRGLDPHIWLSPPLVKKQAHVILTALQKIDPSHSSAYEANFREFVQEIEALDAELKKIFAAKRGFQFMVFHPAWGYFAHTYGLHQLPVEIEGKNPKPAQLRELIEHARENDVKAIFVQPQFPVRNAELIAREIGGQVIFADPLAENWAENLRKVARQIEVQLR